VFSPLPLHLLSACSFFHQSPTTRFFSPQTRKKQQEVTFSIIIYTQVQTMLRARPDYSEDRFQLLQFPGTFHGFAVRGDERNPVVQEAKQKVLKDTVAFMQTQLLQ